MLTTFSWFHAFMLVLAIGLEVGANVCLKLSQGFKHKVYGCLSIALVLAAFSCLFLALEGIELSIAYATWGGVGIVATALIGWIMFGQRIRPAGWAGMGLLMVGLLLMKFA